MAKDDIGDSLIKTGLIAGAVFLIAKPLLDKLGVFDSEGKQFVEAAQSLPLSQNPFSYLFQPFQALYNKPGVATNKDSRYQFSGGEAAYWKSVKDQFVRDMAENGNFDFFGGVNLDGYQLHGDEMDTAYYGEKILDSMDLWSHVDTGDIAAVFNAQPSQIRVAAIAAYLWFNYGKDLLPYMDQGSPWAPFNLNGVPNTVLGTIVKNVFNLPVTVPGD